jgi:hypothetical protein
MNKFAIIGALEPPRTGCIAIICGALLGVVAAAGPAQSGDLSIPYQYTGYRYGPDAGYRYGPDQSGYRSGPGYNGCYRNCYPCGCYQCGCNQCGSCGVARRYGQVVERHWVERDYWERRHLIDSPRYQPCGYRPCGYAGGYPNYSGGYAGGYPYYPSSYVGGYPNNSGASGWEPRPHLRFGGIQYQPAPISYEYEAPPRSLYEYEAAPRPPMGIPYYNPGYVDEASPRPPMGMPYYNAGYAE